LSTNKKDNQYMVFSTWLI